MVFDAISWIRYRIQFDKIFGTRLNQIVSLMLSDSISPSAISEHPTSCQLESHWMVGCCWSTKRCKTMTSSSSGWVRDEVGQGHRRKSHWRTSSAWVICRSKPFWSRSRHPLSPISRAVRPVKEVLVCQNLGGELPFLGTPLAFSGAFHAFTFVGANIHSSKVDQKFQSWTKTRRSDQIMFHDFYTKGIFSYVSSYVSYENNIYKMCNLHFDIMTHDNVGF